MGVSYKLYRWLSIALSPFIRGYFHLRCYFGKDEKNSVVNHFGQATLERPKGDLIWIHAASIGESMTALTYIKHFKENHPDTKVLLTTITLTSANLLRQKLADVPGCFHQFVVADIPSWVNRFLDYWQPQKAIFFESEIWPNILHELHARYIPTYLLNARLSDRSFGHWKLCSSLMRELLSMFVKILAQSKSDTEKFAFFETNNVEQMDNLKYANGLLPCDNSLLDVFKSFCAGRNIFVAASTHEGEDEIILTAHKAMFEKIPTTTIIVPRHIQRVKQICELCNKMGLSYSKRTDAVNGLLSNSDIFIVDTYGELGTFFKLAHVVFVGGSLIKGIGGHNLIEPIMAGKPVLHGRYVDNFLEVRDNLHNIGVAYEVNSADDIVNLCMNFFTHPELFKEIEEKIEKNISNHSFEQIDKVIQ